MQIFILFMKNEVKYENNINLLHTMQLTKLNLVSCGPRNYFPQSQTGEKIFSRNCRFTKLFSLTSKSEMKSIQLWNHGHRFNPKHTVTNYEIQLTHFP